MVFHCSGPISTSPFDINSSALQCLHILIDVLFSNYSTIGFNTSIEWQIFDQSQNLEAEDGDSENSNETQPESEDSHSLESQSTGSQSSQLLEAGLADAQKSQLDSNDAPHVEHASEGTHSSGNRSQLDNEDARQTNEPSPHQEVRERVASGWKSLTCMVSAAKSGSRAFLLYLTAWLAKERRFGRVKW